AKQFAQTISEADNEAASRIAADRRIVLDEKATRAERQRALANLAAGHDGAMALIALASEDQLPKQLLDTATDAIYRNSDLGVRALASQYFPRKGASGVALPPIKELATMKGDAPRGRDIFFGNVA